MAKMYEMKPVKVPTVKTKYRRIVTPIPPPQAVPIMETLRKFEPRSMTGQPVVLWDRAEGCQVYDKWGNMWLDFSSGVLVANAGHSNPAVVKAIADQAKHGLLHHYCFPSEMRAKLVKRLAQVLPKKLEKVFLLTTGAETTECAIKLMRTHGKAVGGRKKIGIVSFERGFHGRTLGSQQVGGSPALKEWIVNLDPNMWQVPFPDGYWTEDTSFDLFLKTLEKLKVTPDMVAGVIFETYQGGGSCFLPKEYAQKLYAWCQKHNIILTCDEVQAGFGRTGKMFGFEHYGFVPDLACFGKGISSSLPISAIAGRKELMDQYAPGSMTSTHTGSPVCAAAALASVDYIVKKKLWVNAEKMGAVMFAGLLDLQKKYPGRIGVVMGKGLVYSMQMVKAGGKKEADYDLAFTVIKKCIEKGVLFFAPVGFCSVKIAPPLVVNKAQVKECLKVLDEALCEAISEGA